MRRGQRVLLLVAAVALAVNSARGEEAVKLKVMTFNLRYASDRPPNAWPQRRPVMKELIGQEKPDLIGTQEGLYDQLRDLAADLPDYSWIGLGREGGSHGEFMAIFFLRERFEPLEYDHFWLSDTPEVIGSSTWGNSNRRMVTWIRFRERPSGREFYLANTHFDHEIQEAREKSAALLFERVNKLKRDLPVIVTGDFNAAAGRNKAYEILVGEQGLKDTWVAAAERGEEVGTFHNYRGPSTGGGRIDWILSRGPVSCLLTRVVTFKSNGQYPSDHFPVVAELRLEPRP